MLGGPGGSELPLGGGAIAPDRRALRREMMVNSGKRWGSLQALLLDLDGTLVDTPQAIVEVTQAALAEMNLPPADVRAIKDGIGLPLPIALGELIGRGPAGAAEAVEIYRKIWRSRINPRLPHLLYPGVRAGLIELKSAGLKLGVV